MITLDAETIAEIPVDQLGLVVPGAYAVFRNPAGHQEVDYEDVGEAAEAVQTESLLMRIIDRIEERINRR
jgi:hypothetical protein